MEWRRAHASGAASDAAHGAARVRLGYGLNLHAPRTLAECLAGLTEITLPLRERLDARGAFGAGMYLPAELAHALAHDAAQLARLAGFLAEHALDAFTFNAFPFGGFQSDGLKARVFAPAWSERARRDYTLDVARIAAQLNAGRARSVAISTHTGRFGAFDAARGAADPARPEEGAAIAHLAQCALEFARLSDAHGVELVLALEPEPRANCGDQAELATFHARLVERGARFLAREHLVAPARAESVLARHVGTCLDACHAAVEFEDVRTLRWAGRLGKLQFSSALAVRDPARNPRGRAALLALDEPRFLHQVTGRAGAERVRANDLGEVARACAAGDARWLACDEWRCHFHVPVDLEEARGADGAPLGLATTRANADELLTRLLDDPAAATGAERELAVEIETYTWEVLPDFVRSPARLVDGLEREYRHVFGVLERAGWTRA